MACGEHIRKAVELYSDKIINEWDYVDKSILIFLFHKNGIAHCYDLSSFLTYVEGEDKVHLRCESLRDVGLIQIYDVKESFVKTVLYDLTDFGREVAKKIIKHEEENGYPTTKKFIDRNLEFLKDIDGEEETVLNLETIINNLTIVKV